MNDLVRALLALHESVQETYRPPGGIVKYAAAQCVECAARCHSRSGLSCEEPVDAVYPCATVKLITEHAPDALAQIERETACGDTPRGHVYEHYDRDTAELECECGKPYRAAEHAS